MILVLFVHARVLTWTVFHMAGKLHSLVCILLCKLFILQ